MTNREYYRDLIRKLVDHRPCSSIRVEIDPSGAIVLAADDDDDAILIPLNPTPAEIDRIVDQLHR